MGRKHYTQSIPQHSRHAKRVDQWPESERARLFSARRSLESPSLMNVMEGIRELQIAGQVPAELRFRPRAHVDLVPGHVLGEQAMRGIVSISDRDLFRMERNLMGTDENLMEPVDAEIKSVSMKRGGTVRITLVSEKLEAEREAVAEALESIGFQGIHRYRQQTALHIHLATSRRDRFSYAERQHTEAVVAGVIDQIHHFEAPLAFGKLVLSPQFEELAA